MSNIPPFRLVPEPMNGEAKKLQKFKWAPDFVGQRHKLGGTPDFIHEQQIPICKCSSEMTFYAQIDSINEEFNIVDCGMIYLFICFDCFDVVSIVQNG